MTSSPGACDAPRIGLPKVALCTRHRSVYVVHADDDSRVLGEYPGHCIRPAQEHPDGVHGGLPIPRPV